VALRRERSRVAVAPIPLIRELVALDEEFGTVVVVACDRTAARFFAVTAFDCVELTGLAAVDASRGGKFHGSRQVMARAGTPAGSPGEHNYHMRIRTEKQRLYAQVADRLFQIHNQRPLAGLVAAGIGADAAALLRHLHTYLRDLVLGVVKLNPKRVTPAEVREVALALREERVRAWERAHADAIREDLGTGWAVNGIEATLKALRRGQVRTLLADGHDDDPRIDEAIEEALIQHAQVAMLYDDRARRAHRSRGRDAGARAAGAPRRGERDPGRVARLPLGAGTPRDPGRPYARPTTGTASRPPAIGSRRAPGSRPV